MTKKLVIRFVKFESAIAGQLLEAEGFNWIQDDSAHIRFFPNGFFVLWNKYITIPNNKNHQLCSSSFADNAERDNYLNNVIKWISEEQFRTNGKLEIGKKCEASDDGEEWRVRTFAGELAKQLGEPRHLVAYDKDLENFKRYKYVRPLSSFVQPKIEGDIYTWETEVSDER